MTANLLKKCFTIGLFVVAPSAGTTRVDTLAIVPFSVIGDSANAEIYSYGLPEAIANELSRVSGLTIVERLRLSAVLQEFSLSQAGFVGEQEAPRIGELLGAKIVLVGTVHQSATEVRVYVRGVSVASGKVIFSVKAEQGIRTLSDIFKLEDVLARKVVLRLGLAMAEDEMEMLDQNFDWAAMVRFRAQRAFEEFGNESTPNRR